MRKVIVLNGQKFGRLTVIEDSGKRYKNDNKAIYLCKCDCGNETLVYHSSLVQGKTRSCGCLAKEVTSKRNIKSLVGLRFGRLEVINMLDERKNGVIQYICRCDCGNMSIVSATALRGTHATRSCGCLAVELLTKDVVKGTKASILTAKINCTNTSGFKGVSFDKRSGRWVAYITFRRKRYQLGLYDTEIKAAEVRKMAENKMFGEFLDWYNNEYRKESPNEIRNNDSK